MSDGRFETRVFETPVNYRAEDGHWKPIDRSLEEPPTGGLTNAANSFDLHLPNKMGNGSVRLSVAGEWLSYRLLGPVTEPVEVEHAVATYDTHGGDLSFELHSLANGVKEEIVLADSSQPRRYRFALDFSQGLTPHLRQNGSIAVENSAGALFATLPAPTIFDGSQDPPVDAAHYILREGSETGRWTLDVEAEEAWLADPDRSWPVTIDPSAFIPTEQNCSIGSTPLPSGWTVCGNNGATELTTAYSQKEKQPVRTFLRFKLGSPKNGVIPWNAYISKATLRLYAPNSAENTLPGLETRRVTKDWTTALNWQRFRENSNWTTPGGDFTSEGRAEVLTTSRGSGPGWWEFSSQSLRDLVEAWVEFLKSQNSEIGLKNQGVIVKQIDETRTAECESSGVCPRRYVAFNSSAAASNNPELVIIYLPKAPSSNKLTSPTEGTTTARRLMLRSAWAPGVTGVRYQYRAGKKGQFTDIPAALLRNAKGEPVEELAVSESCCQSERLYFDAAHVNSELQGKGGTVQVRALFEGGTGAGFSEPVEAKVDRYLGGPQDEAITVGPGTLDLLTGNLSLGASDVQIGGYRPLSFSRSYNTRDPGSLGEKSILGQGWKSGAELDGGSDWLNIALTVGSETIDGETYNFEYATVRSIKGATLPFEKVEGKYVAPDELPDYSLVLSEGKFILTDPGGNKTTFGNENSGNASEYLPISVTEPGGGSTVTTWAFVNGQRRMVREVSPTAAMSSTACAESPTTKSGCHTLEFTYAPASNWGAPSSYGDRLENITYYAPGEGGPWEVAAYAYDNLGRLVSAWDPRIGASLKDTYTYEGERLWKAALPGQEPWIFEYTPNLDGESGPVSRLKAVKRSNLLGGETATSIRYQVPLSGSNAPNDMSASSIASWGQLDLPTDATAVFPPSEVPAEPASSYEKATVYYMDSEGFGVNTAMPQGAGMTGMPISTTETDEFGNITRELSPQNRLRALADPGGKTVERSHLLERKFTYSADGTELLEERGPLHRVKLQEGGEIAEARLQRSIAYDNPENLNPAPLVPTREVTGAVFPAKGTEVDQRVTEYKYNWKLRERTEAITDAGIGHLNIRRKIAYDPATGQRSEVRQPVASEEAGNVPGAIKTTYFENNPNGCPAQKGWSGLPCKIEPAAQPVSGPALPITWIKSYSPLGKPTEIVQEVPGAGEAGLRRTVFTYDSAGRQTSKKVTGGGQAVPKVEYFYSPTNGMPTTQRFACEPSECAGFDTQATTTNYDALGRVSSYEDADGNKAETVYDSFGRPSSFSDGKGSQSLEYDPVTGLLIKLTDSAAGAFTASYDADGNMVRRGLPNGLTAESTYDATDALVGLTYTKAASCGVSCTWLSFSIDQSIYGQTLSEVSTLGSDRYAYDRAGRLIEAQETPTGGNCTARSYSYDKDSNRLSLTTRTATLGGACGSGSSTEKKYSYDQADRLVDAGVVYDNFGRITSLPAADAGGNGLTSSYFATNMVAVQSQGGVTNTFGIDASGRQRSRLQGGAGLEGTEVFHYDNPGDSPGWTERGSAWTRNIVGIGGELAAVQENGKEITLPLTNPHGDVVATAGINPEVTSLKGTFAYDEFGNPISGTGARFGWLGGIQRRTELPSGIIQMGARSYVPAIGRFLSTDPIDGGSANTYDYGNADPVNQFDPSGTKPYDNACDPGKVGCQVWLHIKMWSPKGGRMGVRMIYRSNRAGGISRIAFDIFYWRDERWDVYQEGFVEMAPPHYLNSYPGVPRSCRGTDPCANNHDGQGTFACEPGDEYQIQIIFKYIYNFGAGVEESHVLEVKAQEFCSYR
ncbi:MAG TPA: RHS repeat-associated core domain-containing protein [Solirubrobacterales bacterium]|nr:RHS repeat-associated core domain-containing protein [Solirubrobacterales bacterium]